MGKDLIFSNGKLIDVNDGNNVFAGVVPRDLEIGDSFEQHRPDGLLKKVKIKSKYTNDNGSLIIETGGD